MSRYSCCQGYYDCMCWKAGSLSESSCPDVCNFLESFLCFSCSITATRQLVMDTRKRKGSKMELPVISDYEDKYVFFPHYPMLCCSV